MASGRFWVAAAVYGVLVDGNRVLLLRRAGSGYHDGELGLPAGHLDGGEDALSGLLRELRKEITITAERDSCRLVLVMHRAPDEPDGDEYLDLYFTVTGWTGTPAIGEPDKCTELVWANRHQLPSHVIDYVRAALRAIDTGRSILTYGWPA